MIFRVHTTGLICQSCGHNHCSKIPLVALRDGGRPIVSLASGLAFSKNRKSHSCSCYTYCSTLIIQKYPPLSLSHTCWHTHIHFLAILHLSASHFIGLSTSDDTILTVLPGVPLLHPLYLTRYLDGFCELPPSPTILAVSRKRDMG